MPITVEGKNYLTASEASRRLGVSRETFNRNVSGKLQQYRFGALRRIYYLEDDINQFGSPQGINRLD